MRATPSGPGGATATGGVLAFVASILGALGCFVGCAAVVSALARPHHTSSAVLAVVAVGFGGGAAGLVHHAIGIEHGLRSATAARAASAAAAAPPAARGRNGPVARVLAVLAIVGVIAFVVGVSVSLHARAARSAYTQHHGLRRTGTVTKVVVVAHTTRYESWRSYDYRVALSAPAGKSRDTVAHDPTKNFQRFDRAETIEVLVDPEQTGYAELPGRPVQSSDWFLAPLTMTLLFGGLAAVITSEQTRKRRSRRRGATATDVRDPGGD